MSFKKLRQSLGVVGLSCSFVLLACTGPEDDPVGLGIDPSLVAVIAFVDHSLTGRPDTLRVRSGHVGATSDTVWTSGISIGVLVAGGTADSSDGVTDSDGYFVTRVTADPLPSTGPAPDSLRLTITVDDGQQSPISTTSAAVILEPGLRAVYSTGVTAQEGPIFHGWGAECGATGNNVYQEVCTPVDESPVDWAWGAGFSVEWNGFVYSGEGGEQLFNSHFWVDGDVYVEVNGEVVADMNTTGGGYSAYVTLSSHIWLPLRMTFGANGGSNNMQIGWPVAGDPPWAPIPRTRLGTPRSALR
jgi:hypothetical protein